MSRRKRQRTANFESRRDTQVFCARKYVPALPVEILAQIIGYLKRNGAVHYEEPPTPSTRALANVAKVSRLFYELAMPLLWEQVDLWGPLEVRPYTLYKYRSTIGRVSPYIRSMWLCAGNKCNNNNVDKTELNRIWKFASRCLQILTATTSLKSLHLYLHLYNIADHPPKLRRKLKAINGVLFRILRHVQTMNLHEFGWHPGRVTSASPTALNIIGQKVTNMKLRHLECGDWVDHLHHFPRLTSIETNNSRTEDSIEFNFKFWMAIAQLDNCISVSTTDIPIPFGWNIQLANITNLDLSLFFLEEIHNCISTTIAVFKYMPNLETLRLPSTMELGAQQLLEAVVISDVACKNLKSLRLSGYRPSRLLVTIGNQCPNLEECDLKLHNINDDDLYALSQCQRLHRLIIHCPNPIENGLKCLTNLRRLAVLNFHYSFGRHMNTQLLLDFARLCPRLDNIHVADYSSSRSSSNEDPVGTEDVSELFAAGAELRAYIKANAKPRWEKDYLIHVDNLRKDKLLTQ